jgi:single-stranded DNA-binding protein
MNLNRVEIAGGVVRDPEFRHVGANGTPLWECSMALNGTRYDPTERKQVAKTTFVTVQAWGWLAEVIAGGGFGKGDELHVLGELDQTEFEKEDGTKERKTRVNAAIITPLRRRSSTAPPSRPVAAPTGAPEAPREPPGWAQPPPYGDQP